MRLRSVVVRPVALVIAAIVAVAVGIPSSAAAVEKPRAGGSVTWLISAELANLDPVAAALTTSPSLYSIYDRLVYISPTTGQLVPGLALSVTGTNDSSVWTIKLRAGVRFTDGTALDAAAVKFNWDRVRNTATAPDRTTVQSFSSYDVVDPRTLRVTLPQPNGSFPVLLQSALGTIASPTALQKYGSSYGSSAATIVGAGPFKVSEWVRDDHMTLERNGTYWDRPRPYLDSLVLKPVADPTQKANAFLAGQADMAWMPTISPADQLLVNANTKYASVVQDGGFAVLYNMAKAPLNDTRVRQALTLAIDLKDLNTKASNGLALTVGTWAPKTSPFYDPEVKQQTDNLAKAQKLIDAYVAEHAGSSVSFSFLIPSSLRSWSDPLMQQWAQLKGVNVTADIQPPTGASAKGFSGNFEAWFGATLPGKSPRYPASFYQLYRTGQATNIQKYTNPTLDKVLDASQDSVSLMQRRDDISRITQMLIDDSVFTMINRLEQRTYYSNRMRGVAMIQDQFPGTASLWVSRA